MRAKHVVPAAVLLAAVVCASPEVFGPVALAVVSGSSSVALEPVPDSSCVLVFKANADTAAKAHLKSTQLTGYQRRVLVRLDSLARVHCPAVVVPVPLIRSRRHRTPLLLLRPTLAPRRRRRQVIPRSNSRALRRCTLPRRPRERLQ
jgi:hypothetical protein